MMMKRIGQQLYKRYVKRTLDFFIAIAAIILLSPILSCIYLLVRIKLGKPAIFVQERPGLNEKIFKMYKFRTMKELKDSNGNDLPDGQRITRFGKTLRAMSLDELPELFNILIGDMSFIGPRPLLIRYLPYYTDTERQRSNVRPGLTGLAQVSGRNALSWNERFQLDVDYVNNLAFYLDFKIIVKTVVNVMSRKDVLVGTEHILKDLDEERSGGLPHD